MTANPMTACANPNAFRDVPFNPTELMIRDHEDWGLLPDGSWWVTEGSLATPETPKRNITPHGEETPLNERPNDGRVRKNEDGTIREGTPGMFEPPTWGTSEDAIKRFEEITGYSADDFLPQGN